MFFLKWKFIACYIFLTTKYISSIFFFLKATLHNDHTKQNNLNLWTIYFQRNNRNYLEMKISWMFLLGDENLRVFVKFMVVRILKVTIISSQEIEKRMQRLCRSIGDQQNNSLLCQFIHTHSTNIYNIMWLCVE